MTSEGRTRRVGALRASSAAVFVILVLAACGGRVSNPFQRSASAQVTLVVESRNWSDQTIYLDRSGARSRLGTVTSNQTRTFRLPADIATPGATVRFQADPIGSSRVYSSPQITVGGGETWVWTLMPQIEQSTLFQR